VPVFHDQAPASNPKMKQLGARIANAIGANFWHLIRWLAKWPCLFGRHYPREGICLICGRMNRR